MASPLYLRAFSNGELGGSLAGRADLPIYAQGLKRAYNFSVHKHGGVSNRPGTKFVGRTKDDSVNVKLVRYTHETRGDSVLIEMGVSYFRFWVNDALVVIPSAGAESDSYDNSATYGPGEIVTSASVWYLCIATTTGNSPPDADYWVVMDQLDENGDYIYEIPTPFTLPREVKWAQSGRTITFTHQSVRPRDLLYVASDYWVFEDVVPTSGAGTPQNPTVGQGPEFVSVLYEVRAVLTATGAGPLSAPFTSDVLGPPSVERPITVTWDEAIEGPADYYELYKGGYLLGTTPSLSFSDEGQATGDPWAAGIGGDYISEPLNVDATQGPATPILKNFRYVMTAVVAGEESLASDVASAEMEDATSDRPHLIDGDDVTDATEYRFYADPNSNGTFGRIGSGPVSAFAYPGLPLPDYALVPPTEGNFFGVSDFPATVGYYEQRRFFGNKPSSPDAFAGSRVGLPTNFTISTPLQDSDAISLRLLGRTQHAVREIVGLGDLIVLTDGGEWRSRNSPGLPLTPSNLPFYEDTYVGCHDRARYVLVGGTLIYVQARGHKVVEARFENETQKLANRDLTVLAPHLFEADTIVALDYQYEPDSIIWCARSDGRLLGLTYQAEADALAWHQHQLGGTAAEVEDVCVVPDVDEDVVYLIVSRTVTALGGTVRFIERLANRVDRSVFLDCATEYQGVAITTLDVPQLDGETVTIWANGQKRGTGIVDGGAIALGGSYAHVVVGYPIVAELETLDADAPGSTLRQTKKKVSWAAVLVDRSVRNFYAGADFDSLQPYTPADYEGVATAAFTGLLELSNFASTFEFTGGMVIRHTEPTPLTILGLLPNLDIGG